MSSKPRPSRSSTKSHKDRKGRKKKDSKADKKKGERSSCHRCKKVITNSQFIRAGEYKFHTNHFTCVVCDTSLHGQKFRPKAGQFYCEKDYVDKFCHTCRHCKQKIAHGAVIQAFGGFYHPKHFVCATCEKPFPKGRYYDAGNQPYCEEHYFALSAEKCEQCQKPVTDNDMVRVQGKVYHNTCLSCYHCGLPLARKGSIFQKDNHVFCRTDYLNFFCKRCTACAKHVLHHCISVNDEYYHPDCLKCSICEKKLAKYICIGGHLRCPDHTEEECDNFLCDVCGEEVEDDVVLSVGKKVHQACFNCSICAAPIEKAQCKLRAGLLSCAQCVQSKPRDSAQSVDEGQGPIGTPVEPGPSTPVQKPSPKEVPQAVVQHGDSTMEWRKGQLIGSGAFGKVYMAMNAATGELIAVKQVRLANHDLQDANTIESEIKLLETLRHPNIVSLLGTQRTEYKLNILMEYVPGNSLDKVLGNFGSLDEAVTRSYTKQLLDALDYCHLNNVVHRDIKGKNILIDTKGTLKLADFGSAKRFSNGLSNDAPSLSYNYTPLWTAPEVLVGNYNSKVDIWSLGCVIIEMATGKAPWAEENFENPFRALYHIGHSGSIPALPPSLSALGKEFLLLCLQRDPEKRPNAATLLKHAWLDGIDATQAARRAAALVTAQNAVSSD